MVKVLAIWQVLVLGSDVFFVPQASVESISDV